MTTDLERDRQAEDEMQARVDAVLRVGGELKSGVCHAHITDDPEWLMDKANHYAALAVYVARHRRQGDA